MTRAAIYCRISLDRTGQQAGVERQETECRELAARVGLDIAEVFVDNDISAFSGKRRPAYEALLDSGAEAIVVWHIDRLVRRTRDLQAILDLGVDVHAVSSGFVDLSTPAGRLSAKVVVSAAEYESEQKGERQKAMHRQRRAQGGTWWHGRPPPGFNADGSIEAEGAARLRQAYEDFLVDPNLSARARDLGLKQGGIRRTFLAERNIRIVGEELFEAVTAIIAPREKGPRQHTAMLTGIAQCGTCGGTCGTGQQRRAQAGPEPVKAYRCRKGHVWWVQSAVDEYVGAQVAAVLEANRAAIEAKVEDSADELQQLAVDYAAGVLSSAEFMAAADRIKRRAARPSAPMKAWGQMSAQGRRRLCSLLLEAVVLPPRGKGHGGKPLDMSRLELRWRTPAG